MRDIYGAFGLTDAEISLIAGAEMKRDYFYTSPLGRRLFRLDLGPLALALVGSPDHALLDRLEEEHGPGAAFCRALLEHRGIRWRRYAGPDMPKDPVPHPPSSSAAPQGNAPQRRATAGPLTDAARLVDAVRALPGRRGRGSGSGRAAAGIAEKFAVSQATVYQARAVLKSGDAALLDEVRGGRVSVSSAYKRLKARLASTLDGAP
jgi:hypothetical protein